MRLYNFGAGNTDLTVSFSKDQPEILSGVNVLVRYGTELKYASLSVDFSAGNISADSTIDGIQQKSIETKHSDDLSTDYFQLYNFDKTNTDLTVVTNTADGYTPTNQLVLVKNTSSGQLQYARLFAKTRTDTEYDQFSRSIEYNKTNNEIKINGWSTKANTAASTVSADAASYDVLMRHRNGS